MRHSFKIVLLALFLSTLNSCNTWRAASIQPGQTESSIITQLGRPTHVYQDGNTHLLEYMHGPMGQTTDMIRVGGDGKFVSYEQVLTSRKFATIKLGEATKNDVLRTVGAPSETSYFPLVNQEAWSYPYKQDDVWNSIMWVFFDKDGIVRKMENGPDPRRESKDRGKH